MFYKVVDCPSKDVVGLNDRDIFPEPILKELNENDRKIAEFGDMIYFEEKVPHPDGSVRTYDTYKFPMFDENGEIFAITGISLDITEKKKTESALRTSMKLASLGEMAGGVAHGVHRRRQRHPDAVAASGRLAGRTPGRAGRSPRRPAGRTQLPRRGPRGPHR